MFDKEALNKLNSLKAKLPAEKKQKKNRAPKEVIPLVDEAFSRNKDWDTGKKGSVPERLVKEIFLKEGQPTVEQAVKRLNSELPLARKQGYKVVRLIHGYGSSGSGGALKEAIVDPLQWMVNEGTITGFIVGEKFNCFNGRAVSLVNRHPALKKDHDYRFENPGITIVIL